jgi:hypothetical protein
MQIQWIVAVLGVLVSLGVQAGVPCDRVESLASNAAFYRDAGLTADQVRYPLPPRNYFASDPPNPKNALLQLMHQIVDELFAARQIDGETYKTFKFEQCRLGSAGLPVTADYSAAIPKLAECGKLKAGNKSDCAKKAAGAGPPIGP